MSSPKRIVAIPPGLIIGAPEKKVPITAAKATIDYESEIDSVKVRDKIYQIRMALIKKYPFFATIALRLEYVEVLPDSGITTMAVDGRNLYYNANLVDMLPSEELQFMLCHEIYHLAFKHLTRRGKRDHRLYNIACDYVINAMLLRDEIGKFPSIGGLYKEEFKGMTSEQVYRILEEEGDNENLRNFDDHIKISQVGQTSGDGVEIELSQEELDELDSDLTAMLISAAAAGKSAGNLPGEIERLVGTLTEPTINWRELIRETANGQVITDYTRTRPNRRLPVAVFGTALPVTRKEDHVSFSIAIDTSGSIDSNMLRDFLSEMHGIVEQFSSFDITIWCFDTVIYNPCNITQDNADDLSTYKIKGNGGTSFIANWEYMKEVSHVPSTFVMLTDGYPSGSWGDPEYCETIFIIHDKSAISNKIVAPFGTTVYFDDI